MLSKLTAITIVKCCRYASSPERCLKTFFKAVPAGSLLKCNASYRTNASKYATSRFTNLKWKKYIAFVRWISTFCNVCCLYCAAVRLVRLGGSPRARLPEDGAAPHLRQVPRPARLHPETDQQHISAVRLRDRALQRRRRAVRNTWKVSQNLTPLSLI